MPTQKLLSICESAIIKAEAKYKKWSGGTGMRHAPESFLQYFIAESIYNGCKTDKIRVKLEELVGDVVKNGIDLCHSKSGRFDIVVCDNTDAPLAVIELKKITEKISLSNDHKRIRDVLKACPNIEIGIMIGYFTAKNLETLSKRLQSVCDETGSTIVGKIDPIDVRGKQKPCYLGAAIYRVDRI